MALGESPEKVVEIPGGYEIEKMAKVQLTSNFRHLVSDCAFFMPLCYDALWDGER